MTDSMTVEVTDLPGLDETIPCECMHSRGVQGSAPCGQPSAVRVRARCEPCAYYVTYFSCAFCRDSLGKAKVFCPECCKAPSFWQET